ncbi:Hpt domain-containing protein [Schlesneria sp. DSM 10557]|uniref:Hpt domain-containing protein n=1 Tax=Schlesneria sp. DSM 10557 TaxID=3044399 RepID=UPI0035A015F8
MISISQGYATANRQVALKRLAGNEALFKTLIGFFLEDAPSQLAQLQQAMAIADWPTVAMKAHSLKGLSSTFEAIPFMQLAAAVESQAVQENQFQIAETVRQLQSEFHRLVAELQSYAR